MGRAMQSPIISRCPGQFADSPLLQAGEVALDAATGQIVREERNVYAGNPGKAPARRAHHPQLR